MVKAIDELNKMHHIYDLKGEFFQYLHAKVPFSGRPQYIKILSRIENLDINTKLNEPEKCKGEWEKSSAALASTYESLGVSILQLHAEDFVSFGQLSGYNLKEVSDLSEVPIATLALEIIKVFVSLDSFAPSGLRMVRSGFQRC